MRVSTLILAVRNTTKGEEARRELLSTAARTKISEPRIEVWKLDLCSYASIISFADRCKSLPRLDAVLENAGINTYDFVRAEGDESTITTNVLGTFLLGILLLPTLRMSAKRFEITPRIAFVGSVVHFFAPTKELMVDGNIFDTLSNPNNADMKARYFVSKLVATMMIRELAERITASSKSSDKPMIILTDNAPGLNKTFLTTNSDANDMGPRVAVKLMARKPEIGARTLVQGLVAGQEAHGKYLSECVVKPYVAPGVTKHNVLLIQLPSLDHRHLFAAKKAGSFRRNYGEK